MAQLMSFSLAGLGWPSIQKRSSSSLESGTAAHDSDVALIPEVEASLFCTCRSVARIASGLASLIDGESDTPNVKTLRASKPGFTRQSAFRLRIISPAAISNTSAIAISATTNTPRARCLTPPVPRPPSFSVSCKFGREIFSAGTSPNTTPQSSAIPPVNSKTFQSIPISFARGNPEGKCCRATFVPHTATSNPRPPPASDSTILSVKSWRTIRPRPAPQRGANRKLSRTPRRTHQEQVGDVHARNQQHKSDGREQHQQQQPHFSNHQFLQGNQRGPDPFVRVRIFFRQMFRHAQHVGPRLLNRCARFQPPKSVKPQPSRPALQQRIVPLADRHIDFARSEPSHLKFETRGYHSYDRVASPFQCECFSQNFRR